VIDLPYLALVAGPLRVALRLAAIRQILDAGSPAPGAEPENALSLARLLGEEPLPRRPAILAFEASGGGLLRLSVCQFHGVFRAGDPQPLPPAVLVRWPGLVRGTLRHEGLIPVLDELTLRALIDDDPLAAAARVEAAP
jgi:hypothetical protein